MIKQVPIANVLSVIARYIRFAEELTTDAFRSSICDKSMFAVFADLPWTRLLFLPETAAEFRNMTYDPYQQQSPYPPPRHREDGTNTVIAIIRAVTGLITAIFVLHILFVVFDANQGNEFVSLIYTLAKALVLSLGDVFTPDDAKIGVVLNYGFATILYLVVSQFIIKALRHR